MTIDSEEEVLADLEYWQELASLVEGWRVYGWTYRRSVTYITPGKYGVEATLIMDSQQRDDLVRAIKGEKE